MKMDLLLKIKKPRNHSICRAYQAFVDSNIKPDFVSLGDIGEYDLIYLPYPVMLKNETAAKLREYVEQGGTLISEGLPGYFGDHGHVGTVQPTMDWTKSSGHARPTSSSCLTSQTR